MKNIFDYFLYNSSDNNQKIIENYINKSESLNLDFNPDDRFLVKVFNLPFEDGNHIIEDNFFNIHLTYSHIEFIRIIPFNKEYDFHFNISKRLNKNENYFLEISIFGQDKIGGDFLRYTYMSEGNYPIQLFSSLNCKIEIDSFIDLTNKKIYEFIADNYHQPNQLKDFFYLNLDIDISKDLLFNSIFKSASFSNLKKTKQLKI